MKVTVMKKATVTDVLHGKSYSTDVHRYEAVTNIEETTYSNKKYYQLTYTEGGSSSNTAQYSQEAYILNILP